MLKQHINLFKPFDTSSQQNSLLTWLRFLKLNIFFTAALVMMLLISWARFYHTSYVYSSLKASQAELANEFNRLKESYPPVFFTEDITKTVSDLKKQIDEQRQLLSSTSTTQVFSGELLMFANLTVEGVWLTNIIFVRNGNEVTLKGNSLSLDMLQQYIAKILHEPAFANFTLQINHITNPPPAKEVATPIAFDINLVKKII